MNLLINILDISSFLLILGGIIFLFLAGGKWKQNKLLITILLSLALFYLFDRASDEYLFAWLTMVSLYTLFGPLLLTHLQTDLSIHPQPGLHAGHMLFPSLNFCLMLGISLMQWEADEFYEHPLFFLQMFAVILSMLYYVAQMLLLNQRASWQTTQLPAYKIKWAGSLIGTYAGFTILALAGWFLFPITDEPESMYVIDSLGSFILIAFILIQVKRINPFRNPSSPNSVPIEGEAQRWLDLFTKIDYHVRSKELFLDPQLKVEALAKLLNTNSRYISRAINTGHGESFSHYINSLRIGRFKEFLVDERKLRMTLDALAQECGFHSRSSLNRFFRQVEGMTPSEYRESQKYIK